MLDFTADGHNFNLASRQFDDEYLEHWGIKGMKWGRRRFQNKDGSLTPEGKKRYGDNADDAPETEEHKQARRASALKSTDAQEIYKNRDVLTTNEINERLSRLDAEKRLARAMEESMPKEPPKKTMTDRVDKALTFGRKMGDVYNFAQTPMMKALAKKMGLSKEAEKVFNLDKFIKNIDKKSHSEVAEVSKRVLNEKMIRDTAEKFKQDKIAKAEAALKKMQEQAEANKTTKKMSTTDTMDDYIQKPSSGAKDSDNVGAFFTNSSKAKEKAKAGKEYMESIDLSDGEWINEPASSRKNQKQAAIGEVYLQQFLLSSPRDEE